MAISTPKPEFAVEEVCDEIYELLGMYEPAEDAVPPKVALEALIACIMGTTQRCADPNRALLAVIAELTNLVRFPGSLEQEAQYAERGWSVGDQVLSLQDWIADAWK